jgi:hypothetical protein
MTQPPSVYSEMISARSRRLRTIGTLLLAAVALMTFYGAFFLMPSINRAVAARHAAQERMAADRAVGTSGKTAPLETPGHLTRSQKAEKLQVAVVFAYWGVCALLVIAALLVAWLDLREISRTYIQQRRQLWIQTTDRIVPDNASEGETAGGQGQT